MIFDIKTKLSIIKIAIITSAIFSALTIAPLFIINVPNPYQFFKMFLNLLIRYILLWIFEYYVITNFENKFLKNTWIRIILNTLTIMLLDYIISIFSGEIYPVENMTKMQNFIGIYVHILTFALLTNFIFQIILSKENELKKQDEISELKFQNLESEYNLLKSQINPHFIFNALNTSKALIKDKPDEAEKYIVILSEFIRASIPYDKKTATINEELDICRKYFELQKVRFAESFNVEITIERNFLRYHIPFFTLLTLIENAFKHNIFTSKELLEIKIYNESDYIIVENNLNIKNAINSNNIGLKNLNQRVKIISGKQIIIMKDENTYKVKVKMLNPEDR